MTPMQVLLGAQAATEKAGSARMSMEATSSVSGGESFTIKGTGAFDFVQRRGTMHSSFPSPAGGELALDMVITPTTIYMKSAAFAGLVSKPWLSIDLKAALGSSLSQLGSADPTEGLAFLQGAKDVSVVGVEEVRGAKTTHYRATVDITTALSKLKGPLKDAAARMQERVEQPNAMPVEVWVDGSNRVVRSRMTVRTKASTGTDGKSSTSVVTSEMFDFGVPVTVTIPPADQVADGSAILGGARG